MCVLQHEKRIICHLLVFGFAFYYSTTVYYVSLFPLHYVYKCSFWQSSLSLFLLFYVVCPKTILLKWWWFSKVTLNAFWGENSRECTILCIHSVLTHQKATSFFGSTCLDLWPALSLIIIIGCCSNRIRILDPIFHCLQMDTSLYTFQCLDLFYCFYCNPFLDSENFHLSKKGLSQQSFWSIWLKKVVSHFLAKACQWNTTYKLTNNMNYTSSRYKKPGWFFIQINTLVVPIHTKENI